MKKIKITESQLKRLVVREQLLKNIGNKIKTGVQGVVDKVKGATQNKEVPQPGKPDKGRDLEQLRAEWSKINQDTSNMRGYGEAVGQTENSVKTAAMMRAKTAILKKLNKPQARFGAVIIDEALFQLENGNYIKLVVLELTKVWEDENGLNLNESVLTKLVKRIVENISTEGIPQEDLDALRAQAQEIIDNNKLKAQKAKEELDSMEQRMKETIEKGDLQISQAEFEDIVKIYTEPKRREYEAYVNNDNNASIERYFQSLLFDYKRKKAYEDYEREKIERRKTKKITKKDIIDLFVTALEGGSNYWYYLPEIPSGVRDIKRETGMETSEAIGEYVLRGGNIQVNDAEEEEEVLGTVDMGSLMDAIQKLKEDYPRTYENIIDEEYDAEDADIFFQIATMGDVVFG
jgi:hypothetical protein